MLVILSDLHFCDETAVERNVDPADLRPVMEEIYALAGTVLSRDPARRQLDVVLLGDVFDLLRTERWFVDAQGAPVPLSERPWGSADALDIAAPSEATLVRARAITREIIAQNAPALALLRGEGLDAPKECQVRRIFIPGNHDRLYLHDPEIRRLVREALGAVDERTLGAEGIHQHRLELPRYGLLCRHGHEWDPWNFERYAADALPASFSDDDYLLTPIGDPITAELVARLPFELRRRMEASPALRDTPELPHVYGRMQRIEDVRPLMASFQWIFFEANRLRGQLQPEQSAALSRALNDTLASIAGDFSDLAFYKAWRERHDRFLRIDPGDKLAAILEVFRTIGYREIENVGRVLQAAQSVAHWFEGDAHLMGAAREELGCLGNDGLRFVVYGHTHEPAQVALRADTCRDVYFNSGTWRRRQHKTQVGAGFVGWQHFTYLIFYDEQEANVDGRTGPAFEAWMGAQRKEK